MYNYTPQATHHAKFDFDPTTWVVWANSQFATLLGVFLPCFLPFFFSVLRLAYVTIVRLVTCFAPRMCLLRVRIFIFHTFAYCSPKIVEIKPEIGNFMPKC